MASSTSAGLHRPSGRSAFGLALALTTVSLWSILPVGLKIALGGLDAMTLTWIRFVAAATFLGVLLRMRGSMPRIVSTVSGMVRRSQTPSQASRNPTTSSP